jgi:hypothetical protein
LVEPKVRQNDVRQTLDLGRRCPSVGVAEGNPKYRGDLLFCQTCDDRLSPLASAADPLVAGNAVGPEARGTERYSTLEMRAVFETDTSN